MHLLVGYEGQDLLRSYHLLAMFFVGRMSVYSFSLSLGSRKSSTNTELESRFSEIEEIIDTH